MENLWPVDLLSPLSQPSSEWDIFEAQSVAVTQATLGLVQGEVRRRDTAVGRSWSLYLYPSRQPAKGYEFVVLRSAGEDFPAALEVFHLSETHRIWQVRDSSELRRALRKILSTPATSRVLRLLAEECAKTQNNRGVDDRDDPAGFVHAERASNEGAASIQGVRDSSRPIAVGGLVLDGTTLLATVNLLGISGFVRKDELEKLVMKPGSKGSAITSLNGRFVLAVSFVDSVRMTLSADELTVLQSEVGRVLREGNVGEA